MIERLNQQTIDHISAEYARSDSPWYLGFSGGKDSSALLKLTFQALKQARKRTGELHVIYCDTGVEIPVVRSLVLRTLKGIAREAREHNLPIRTRIVSPPVADRYFVKVLGRGYPPPTNKFRWCTDKLRINPIKNLLLAKDSRQYVMLLGIRRGESVERDRTISRHLTSQRTFFRQSGSANSLIFGPIVNYTTDDVWETLLHDSLPISINSARILSLYKGAGGECPVIREDRGTPCGRGRFGCWTCTVVRKDKALTNLIKDEGYSALVPLLSFRNWLISIRDIPSYRCKWRRNGTKGLGPLTMEARREAFQKLLECQSASGLVLITRDEIAQIRRLWKQDTNSKQYRE